MIRSLENVTSASFPAQNYGEDKKEMSTFKKVLIFAGGALSATALFALKRKANIKQIKGLEEQLSQATKSYQENIEQYAKELSKTTPIAKPEKKVLKSVTPKAKKTTLGTLSKKEFKELLNFDEEKLELAIKNLKAKGCDIVLNGFTPKHLVLTHEIPAPSNGLFKSLKGLKDGLSDVTLFQKYNMEQGSMKEILKISKDISG